MASDMKLSTLSREDALGEDVLDHAVGGAGAGGTTDNHGASGSASVGTTVSVAFPRVVRLKSVTARLCPTQHLSALPFRRAPASPDRPQRVA
jgi:hypothetical protein